MSPLLLLPTVTAAILASALVGDVYVNAGPERARQLVHQAIERGVREAAPKGAKVDIEEVRLHLKSHCAAMRAELMQNVEASGRIGVRLVGRSRANARRSSSCSGFAWARVRLAAPAWVTTDAVERGAPLGGHVQSVMREVRVGRRSVSGPVGHLVASRPLKKGSVVESHHVRSSAAAPGTRVPVRLQLGSLAITMTGVAVSSRKQRACARLPSGRITCGIPKGGVLVVEEGLP